MLPLYPTSDQLFDACTAAQARHLAGPDVEPQHPADGFAAKLQGSAAREACKVVGIWGSISRTAFRPVTLPK